MIVISSSVPNIEAILVKSFQNMRLLAVSVQWTVLKLNRQPQSLPGFQIWKSAAATKAWPDSFDCCWGRTFKLKCCTSRSSRLPGTGSTSSKGHV